MTKSGFDLDEIERLLAAADELAADMAEIVKEWERDEPRDDWFLHQHDHADAVEMLNAQSTAIRELRAENARLKGHWSALDKALADNIIETDQPHRVRWEGEWHYGPLADAYFAMTSVVRKLARAALGEP